MNTIRTVELSCGMPLVVEEMSGVQSVGLSWLVPAGPAAEPMDRLGMSAMTAELLLRGAGNLDSRGHADALDRLGVGRSADASGQHIRMSATMLGARLTEALPLIVDMVRSPRLGDDAVEPARDLALQELESLKDNPQERAVLGARSRHFPEPHGRSSLGTEAGILAVTGSDIRRFWSERARPRGSILAIAGAVEAGAVRARLEELLKDWSGEAAEVPVGAATARGYAHEDDQTNQVQIVVMSDAPPEPDPSSLLEKAVVSVLSGGMSSRLFSEVREKRGLCYAVSAGYGAGRLFGSVLSYVGTTPERAQESLDVLTAELDRINRPEGAVVAEELARAVVGMKSRLVFSGESTSARASSLAMDVYRIGRPRSLEEMAAEVDGLTLESVNRYLSGRRLGRLTIQTLGPRALTPPVVKP